MAASAASITIPTNGLRRNCARLKRRSSGRWSGSGQALDRRGLFHGRRFPAAPVAPVAGSSNTAAPALAGGEIALVPAADDRALRPIHDERRNQRRISMSFYRGMTCENVTIKGDKGASITAYV